jgi:ABC-type Fe3+/spermidine/putrescine transport system ATPase subunit
VTRVRVAGLHKHFAGSAALDGVDLAAEPGELITLLGPSGCGKTTTLRCIAGFLTPDAGDILVNGASIVATPLRRRDFGVVFQNYALFPHMTVAENVAYGLRVRRTGRAERAARVTEALALVGLDGMADRLPRTLSGGQQQRVALARALVIRPRLLLLDEPLANLDARLRQDMRALIRRVQQDRGITAFYVTHDQAEAMAISDRVAVMERGKVAQFATAREIYQRPVSRYVAGFTGEASAVAVRVLAAAGADRYRVAFGADEADVTGPAGLAAGAIHRVMLRPESLALTDAGIPGIVQGAAYLGAAQQCEVRLGDAIVQVLAAPNHALAPGAVVRLSIDPAQAWLMPEAVSDR